MGIHHPTNFISFLQSISLYQPFIQKFLKYAELFKGDHLKIISSIFMLRVIGVDEGYRGKVVEIIEGYGKI